MWEGAGHDLDRDVRHGYAEWKGSFYPKGMKPAEMLPYYADRMSTVEINNTFYRFPSEKS